MKKRDRSSQHARLYECAAHVTVRLESITCMRNHSADIVYDLLHPTVYGKNTAGCMTYPARRSQRASGYICHLYDKQTEEKKFEFECPQAYTIRWYVSGALLMF